jgi:hypothetical protein
VVSIARGLAIPVSCSVTTPTGHDGSGHVHVRLRQRTKQLLQTWRMLEDARCIRCCGERVDEIMGQQAQCRWLLERYQVFDPAGDNERHESQQALQRLQEPTPSQDWLAAAQALIRLRPKPEEAPHGT